MKKPALVSLVVVSCEDSKLFIIFRILMEFTIFI